jgi:hypothetical protein
MSNPITWQQFYSRIVNAMPGLARHDDQLDAYADGIQQALDDGTVLGGDASTAAIVLQSHRNRAATYAGRNRLKFLMDLADDGIQGAFALGADYDVPILVCDAATLRDHYRRDFTQGHTVMRSNLRPDDLLLLALYETRKHRERDALDDLYAKTDPVLRAIAAQAKGFATVVEAYRAGAFAVSHPTVSVRP